VLDAAGHAAALKTFQGLADTAAVKYQQQTDTVVLDSRYNDTRAMTGALVEKLEGSLRAGRLDLPSLPEVALKIRRALADDGVSVSEIARLLGTDPALAARTLRIANSAMFYRGSRPITSLNGAVSQLGHKMVRNVALSFAAQQVFIGYGSRSLRDLVSAVWRHSVHAAVISHMLARVRARLDPDEAFLGGLLHEVGRLYILMQAKETVEVLAGDAGFQSVVAAWHPRMGRAVIEAWELSPALAAAVGDHESCSLAVSEPPSMTGIVAVANYLVEHSEAACADAEFHAKAPDFGALSLDKPTFDWLIRAADVDVRLLTISFGV
jgi:HD-like signal output (HDOD) protein